jgi:hypothetical protein
MAFQLSSSVGTPQVRMSQLWQHCRYPLNEGIIVLYVRVV